MVLEGSSTLRLLSISPRKSPTIPENILLSHPCDFQLQPTTTLPFLCYCFLHKNSACLRVSTFQIPKSSRYTHQRTLQRYSYSSQDWGTQISSPSMSDAFIGLTMLVTLSSPPGAQLRGTVSSIEAGKSLTLRNGTKLLSASRCSTQLLTVCAS
jgi:hypothetical protein